MKSISTYQLTPPAHLTPRVRTCTWHIELDDDGLKRLAWLMADPKDYAEKVLSGADSAKD